MAALTPGKKSAPSKSRVDVSNSRIHFSDHDCDKSEACQKFERPAVLQHQNRAVSLDSLLHKPHYMTRHALKRIAESTDSASPLVSKRQVKDFSEQSVIRGSKSRKSFHKFFKRTLRKDAENALNEAKSLENLDVMFTEKNSKENNVHQKIRQ